MPIFALYKVTLKLFLGEWFQRKGDSFRVNSGFVSFRNSCIKALYLSMSVILISPLFVLLLLFNSASTINDE